MKSNLKFIVTIVGLFFLLSNNQAQTLAFPGAEGFGKYVTGGRGGEVYHVTNLNDDGDGSFRDAVSQPNRIVVFDVGGVINITDRIVIQKNITIAGQTAPGGGITIYGNGIALTSSSGNDIIRYIRFRMGKNGDYRKDALGISDGQGYMFDHVSITWGWDGTVDVNGENIDSLTFQDCIIGQGIDIVGHSTGGLFQSGQWSVIRSLFIDNVTRNPKAKGTHEFINSVLYNWDENGYIMGGGSAGMSYCNMLGSYFIYGPSSDASTHFTGANANYTIYGEDNWVDANKNGSLDGSLITDYTSATVVESPYDYPGVDSLLSGEDVVNYVIENVGPSIVRDAVDSLLIEQLKSFGKKGAIIYDEDDNGIDGGVGTVANGEAPLDTDQDGMPDSWEETYGFNINSKVDQNQDYDFDGYTNIEEYLNGTNPLEGVATAKDGTFVLQLEKSGKVVGANESSANSLALVQDFAKEYIQAWILTEVDDSYFKIINKESGLALSVKDASTTIGDSIIQQTYSGADNQLWQISPKDEGFFSFINKNSGLSLSLTDGDTTENTVFIQDNYLDSTYQRIRMLYYNNAFNPPLITVNSPNTENIYTKGDDELIIDLSIQDADGEVILVEIFDNGTKIGEMTSEPFTLDIIDRSVEDHSLVIKAIDNDSISSETSEITFSIVGNSAYSLYLEEDGTGHCSVDVGGSVDSDNEGFSGKGYSNTDNVLGLGIDYYIYVPKAGTYNFIARFANGGDDARPGKLLANDVEVLSEVALPATGSWTTWSTSSFSATLDTGLTVLRLEATTSDGLANIDYIEIIDSTISAVVCQYNLTVSASANGSVDDVSGIYDKDTELSITATPETGYGFSGWTGDIESTDNPLDVTIDEDIEITANFSYLYTLTASAGANGSIDDVNGSYLSGVSIEINATPDDGYEFAGWTGDVESSSNPLTVTMNSDIEVTANFSEKTSISESTAKDVISVYPNPVEDELNIQLNGDVEQNIYISIFNIEGAVIQEMNEYGNLININTSNLDKGIYFIRLQAGDAVSIEKFVKD